MQGQIWYRPPYFSIYPKVNFLHLKAIHLCTSVGTWTAPSVLHSHFSSRYCQKHQHSEPVYNSKWQRRRKDGRQSAGWLCSFGTVGSLLDLRLWYNDNAGAYLQKNEWWRRLFGNTNTHMGERCEKPGSLWLEIWSESIGKSF